jgi:hypothetical protein
MLLFYDLRLHSTATVFFYYILTTFNGNFKCFKFTLSRLWSTGIYVVPAADPAVLYVDILGIDVVYLSEVIFLN